MLGLDSEEKLQEEKRKYKAGLSSYNKKFVHFFLLHPESNEVIGWCGYHIWYTDHDRAEIGYTFFNDEFKNKGFMTEVLAWVLNYGFKEMNLHRVEAFVGTDNVASLKLLDKFGFKKEGHAKEHSDTNNCFEDSLLFALLAQDFQK